jgi:hypothetical protein
MDLITGWLMIEDVATLVKCKPFLKSLGGKSVTLLQVTTPRILREIIHKNYLSKTKTACLRRHIKALKKRLIADTEALDLCQRQLNKTNYQIIKAKEKLVNGKS